MGVAAIAWIVLAFRIISLLQFIVFPSISEKNVQRKINVDVTVEASASSWIETIVVKTSSCFAPFAYDRAAE